MLRSLLCSLVVISAPLVANTAKRDYGRFKILDLILSKPESGVMFDDYRGVEQNAYLIVENNSAKTIFPDGKPLQIRIANRIFSAKFYAKSESGYLLNFPMRPKAQGAFIFTKPRKIAWKHCSELKVEVFGTQQNEKGSTNRAPDLNNPFDSIKSTVVPPLTLMMQIMDERFASPCLAAKL